MIDPSSITLDQFQLTVKEAYDHGGHAALDIVEDCAEAPSRAISEVADEDLFLGDPVSSEGG